MSLRVRLTLFYTSVLGGVLILFGVAVYALVSVVFIRQVDETLDRTVVDILSLARVDDEGRFGLINRLSYNPSVVIQIWTTEGEMADGTMLEMELPLDPDNVYTDERISSDVQEESTRMRVLSLPLELQGGERFGTIQAGIDLEVVDGVRSDMLRSLAVMSVGALSITALAGWLTTKRALEPLTTVTRTATRITRADDLSRRIPMETVAHDEVGQLITAFNETLSRLEELFHTQRRFMTDVSHELRTPLTAIKGNIDLIRRMDEIDDESISNIEVEADRLTRLVGDLLLLAQAESGNMPMHFRLTELDTVFLETYQQARVLAKDRMDVVIGEIDQVLLCGDGDRLKQVMINLVGNAITYTPLGGEVVVSLRKRKDWANFIVSDTGPGIADEDLPHIFERFYRGEKSRQRTKGSKGYGLGLSIAYWIVKGHGGRIEVDSRLGEGTTFNVWLPLTDGDCTSQNGSSETEAQPEAVQA
ncbi:MAG: HAMP domain-containing protein [Chloroflexi bacterium]|nr:MAG: HAMP domain-containing protein [Chloroflexota bacterium]MBL1196119.1 HAMP domain-containing protein [Chloroflexota bacterium]NOH13412.1 HAMP domain-containing protein [Chloroflexota bacterium]